MKIYVTRVDVWLVIVLVVSFLFSIGLSIYAFRYSKTGGIIGIGAAAFLVFMILIFLPCRYIMYDDHLLVQAGILKEKIKYEDIISVEKSSNPLSSPAFSLKRVMIRHGKGFTLVSPKERDEFISELNRRMGKTK